MASILYREGKGTFEHGIECESTTCEPDQVAGLLNAGWSTQPPGYEPPEPVATAEDLGDGVDAEGIEDVKAWLDEQIANLKEQNRILTEMDETSKSELQRLKTEVDRLTGELAFAEEAEQKFRVEIKRLTSALADAKPAEDPVDDDANLNPVRVQAREAGIEGWDTKHIATLKKALSEQ